MPDALSTTTPTLNPGSRSPLVAGAFQTVRDFFSKLPPAAWAALAFATGILLAEHAPLRPALWLVSASLMTSVWLVFLGRRHAKAAWVFFLLAALSCGAARWQHNRKLLAALDNQPQPADRQTVTLLGKVASVPIVYVRPSPAHAPRMFGAPESTRFLLRVRRMEAGDLIINTDRLVQVFVDGDASLNFEGGDTIELSGRWSQNSGPLNPGEYDFRQRLRRQGVTGRVFVKASSDCKRVQAASFWNLRRISSWLFQDARRTLIRNVDRSVQPIAFALLLGNRHELPQETQQAFVVSGTMHLLAISGLHIGILCLFLMKTAHLFLVRRSTAISITCAVCLIYMLLTDLRPSVVRATVFFVLFACGELSSRRIGAAHIVALTLLLMLAWEPELIFDTGAWLSFLAVTVLIQVSIGTENTEEQSAPPIPVTFGERIQAALVAVSGGLKVRFRQMTAVVLLTSPIVARQFHVVSLTGLLINIALIMWTTAALCAGFLTLIAGLFFPPLAVLPGLVFSLLLQGLLWVVELSSALPGGHFYISDLPSWYVPAMMVCWVGLSIVKGYRRRFVWAAAVVGTALAMLQAQPERLAADELRCTVLSIGHGSCAVIETRDHVTVVDAGAMNRAAPAANILCNFLWSRGYRSIDTLIVSHADADHYNAVPDLLQRFDVGEMLTTREVRESDSSAVEAMLNAAKEGCGVVRVVSSGETMSLSEATVTLYQANLPSGITQTDNERSLVAAIELGEHKILLPGDLEGMEANSLYQKIGPVDVVVSPHHGSKNANVRSVGDILRPRHVVVSAKDASARPQIFSAFVDAERLFFTSVDGATTLVLRRGQPIRVQTFVSDQTADLPVK